MHPYLFDWVVNGHHLRPPTYGVLLAVAFTAAYLESLRQANRLDEDIKHIENLFLLIVVFSILGARLFHVIFEDFSYYRLHPSKIFAVWEGGYTFYGALLLDIGAIWGYTRFKKINFLQFGDIAAVATALGLGIGRVGCFFAGCCWGKMTSMPWGVVFSNPDSFAADHFHALHPTQLYEAALGFGIYGYLLWRSKRRSYQGQLFFHGLLIYSVGRFIIEFFRGDDVRGFVFGGWLSNSQLIALMIFPFALLATFLFSRQKD